MLDHLTKISLGLPISPKPEEWSSLREELSRAASEWQDQGDTFRAQVALSEVDRLDQRFGYPSTRYVREGEITSIWAKKIEEPTWQRLMVARLCLELGFFNPALTLIFSLIDSMGWLAAPSEQDGATRASFESWTADYLLAGTSLECTARELYAARCGLLHANSARSKLFREGKVRRVFYAQLPTTAVEMSRGLTEDTKTSTIVLQIEEFFDALVAALERFKDAIRRDPRLSERVEKRADLFLVHASPAFFQR